MLNLGLIYICQAESTGKSQMVMEKMVEGRLHKHYEDDVLMENLS